MKTIGIDHQWLTFTLPGGERELTVRRGDISMVEGVKGVSKLTLRGGTEVTVHNNADDIVALLTYTSPTPNR
jgi:hypothetical protein